MMSPIARDLFRESRLRSVKRFITDYWGLPVAVLIFWWCVL